MATVLDKKPTSKSSPEELIEAIVKLSSDKNTRVLLEDASEWLETKMKEINRIANLLKKKVGPQIKFKVPKDKTAYNLLDALAPFLDANNLTGIQLGEKPYVRYPKKKKTKK